MRHRGSCVEQLVYAVATVGAHHRVSLGLGVLLYHSANITVLHTGLDCHKEENTYGVTSFNLCAPLVYMYRLLH